MRVAGSRCADVGLAPRACRGSAGLQHGCRSFGRTSAGGRPQDLSADDFRFSVELCEDLWMPIPLSSRLAGAGLDCVFNLSASTEFLGKSAARTLRVVSQSAALRCVYAMASAGCGESSSDAVFGGQSLVAADGALLRKGSLFKKGSEIVSASVDWEALAHRRWAFTSLNEADGVGLGAVPSRRIVCSWGKSLACVGTDLGDRNEKVDPHPFLSAFGEPGWVEKLLTIQSVASSGASSIRMGVAHPSAWGYLIHPHRGGSSIRIG